MTTLRTSFSSLQKIGKALMLPVAVLPIVGILLCVGKSHFSFVPEFLSDVMAQSGGAIFGNLPLIFAIGTAIGLAGNDGVAALSAVVGYVVMLATTGVFAKVLGSEVTPVMGIDSINTGVFGGIAIGAMAAFLFNRYYRVQLPPYLGFFSGKRAVPILAAGAALLFGLVLSLCWPPIGRGIHEFSMWAAAGNPALAFSLYGFVERLLIPFGLHHIWNVPFFFESGQYLDPKTGKILTGEIARYIGGDPTAGNLAGGYLFKMWGLPAAALAMWRMARPENRTKILGIMASAAMTSFLTGITEPIEFSFMFVAPALYLVHAFICAAGFWLCIALGIKHGMTFSHGLIDFLLLFPQSHRALWLLVLGPLWAALYYGIFTFAIGRFNLRTPGREPELIDDATSTSTESGGDRTDQLIAAFGGSANIVDLDSCITRLRVTVAQPQNVQAEQLKALGATAVVTVANGIQAIFGTASENLKTDMERRLRQTTASAPAAPAAAPTPVPVEAAALTLPSAAILETLGGRSNLGSVQCVALTRVRVELRDQRELNASTLKKLGIAGCQTLPGGVRHLLVGDQAPALAKALNLN